MASNVSMPTDAETLRFHMVPQKGKLIDIIDSEFGLLNMCLEKRVLSYSDIELIKAKPSRREKNEQLLLFIANNKKEENFLTALRESSQLHVANWIIADGKYRDEFRLDWPLTNKENEKLDMNQSTLVKIIDTCDLLNGLYSRAVINNWQKEFIESKPTSHDKNDALLAIVRRLSRKDYSRFIKCLRDSNQGHVANIIELGGAIVPVHATLQADNLDEAEIEIVNEMTDLLRRKTTSVEHANRLIAELQLNIIAVKRGESIVLYIGCRTEKDLNHLCSIVADYMKMKEILERLFNLFVHKLGIGVLIVLVKISESDLTHAKKTFEKIRRMKLHPNYYDDSSYLGRLEWKMKDDSSDLHEILKKLSSDIARYSIPGATCGPYTRICVDCGRFVGRRGDRKHVKCICGCEFCFVCLKKAEHGESEKELRCKLADTCSLAPPQTKSLQSSFEKFKYPPDFPRHRLDLESSPSVPSQLSVVSRPIHEPSTSFPFSREIEFEKLRTRFHYAMEMEAEEDVSEESVESGAVDVTDILQFRYCVDCGRHLKSTDESNHMKCICGCEFCFDCLKKTEQVGSVQVLRCQLEGTCSVAPRQTKKSFNEPNVAEGWFGSASSESSDPKTNPS